MQNGKRRRRTYTRNSILNSQQQRKREEKKKVLLITSLSRCFLKVFQKDDLRMVLHDWCLFIWSLYCFWFLTILFFSCILRRCFCAICTVPMPFMAFLCAGTFRMGKKTGVVIRKFKFPLKAQTCKNPFSCSPQLLEHTFK